MNKFLLCWGTWFSGGIIMLVIDFLDWALSCFELVAWCFDGERDDLFLFFSFVTSLMIFNCQSMISDAIASRFSHESLQRFIILLVYWFPVTFVRPLSRLLDFNWTSIAWILLSYFLRSLISLLICRVSVVLTSCLF